MCFHLEVHYCVVLHGKSQQLHYAYPSFLWKNKQIGTTKKSGDSFNILLFFCLGLLGIVMWITMFLFYRMYRRCKHLNCLKALKVLVNLSSSLRFIFLFPKTICCYNSFVLKEWLSSYNYHLIRMDFFGVAFFSKVANLFCCVCEVWTINLLWHLCVSYIFFSLVMTFFILHIKIL